MRRESVLVSVIVLSYMAVLNVFIAQFAYKRLSVPSLSEEDPVRLKVAFGRNASSRSLSRPDAVVFRSAQKNDSLPMAFPYNSRIDIAVILGPMKPVLSNSLATQNEMLFLALLQTALVPGHKKNNTYRVWLVVQAEHFMNSYRVWCAALTKNSRHLSTCELSFTTTSGRLSVAAHVHEQDNCIEDLFLVDASDSFPRSMLSRTDTVHSGKVVCLNPACLGVAVYMPPGFLQTAVEQSHTLGKQLLDSDIVESAARIHMQRHSNYSKSDWNSH